MSPRERYLEWRRQPAVGCFFARLIAGRPYHFGQKIETLPSTGTPNRVAGTIARHIDRLIADNKVAAGVLLLPGLVTLERLSQVAFALGDRPNWDITTTIVPHSPAGQVVAVHIVRHVPFNGATCPSEALVLGPFAEFPPTRRSPVTALEIYVGEPQQSDPKTGLPTTKANLAHIEMLSLTPSAIKKLWEKSIEGRLKSLGDKEDSRAKAKISFVIPPPLAQKLGCML